MYIIIIFSLSDEATETIAWSRAKNAESFSLGHVLKKTTEFTCHALDCELEKNPFGSIAGTIVCRRSGYQN